MRGRPKSATRARTLPKSPLHSHTPSKAPPHTPPADATATSRVLLRPSAWRCSWVLGAWCWELAPLLEREVLLDCMVLTEMFMIDMLNPMAPSTHATCVRDSSKTYICLQRDALPRIGFLTCRDPKPAIQLHQTTLHSEARESSNSFHEWSALAAKSTSKMAAINTIVQQPSFSIFNMRAGTVLASFCVNTSTPKDCVSACLVLLRPSFGTCFTTSPSSTCWTVFDGNNHAFCSFRFFFC